MELSSIVPWVVAHFQLGDTRRSVALAEMVFGLMQSEVVSMAAIGRRMPGLAKPCSQITRVYRFCHNPGIRPADVQEALIGVLVRSDALKLGRNSHWVTVSMDWHSYDNGAMTGLRVSLVTGSRAVPLLWYEVRTKDLKGLQSKVEEQAAHDLIRLRPDGVTWLVLLDSGFRSSALLALLEKAGAYAARTAVSTLIHTKTACWTRVGNTPIGLGQVVDFGWVHWATMGHRARVVGARLYQGRRIKPKRRSSIRHYNYTQPGLCIVATSLTEAEFNGVEIIRLYGRRFEIEHSFRDIKNSTYGLDMEHVHLDEAATYSRLMCIVALSEALLWLAGSEATAQGLHLTLTPSRPKSGRRVISLRSVGFLTLTRIQAPIPQMIDQHLSPAIARAPWVIGAQWVDIKNVYELDPCVRDRDEVAPLARSCRRRSKGGKRACIHAPQWRLDDRSEQHSDASPLPKAA